MKEAIGALQAAGWRICLDGKATAPAGLPWDYLPWEDDDLIPLTDAAQQALLNALAGESVPSPHRR
jgi:hypothetical protein